MKTVNPFILPLTGQLMPNRGFGPAYPHLMEINMTNLTDAATTVLAALRSAAESYSRDIDNARWGMVYLDNARPRGMSRHQFAGYLSALKAEGLYAQTSDAAFGEVKMDA